jgi:predicted kinase
MVPPLLIIVAGPPATGKTTLARRISAEFRLPLVYKDGIKERLFDRLGWRDREWSRLLTATTYDILFEFLGALLAAGLSAVTEANFRIDTTRAHFEALQRRHAFRPLRIQCTCDGETLLRRYLARMPAPGRHPGHNVVTLDELRAGLLRGYDEPLPLGGPIIRVDATDFQKVDYAGLLARIREALEAPDAGAD